MKRIISFFLCVLIIFAACITASAENTTIAADIEAQGFMLISENSKLKLYVNVDTAVVKIEDINGGFVWGTNPEIDADDEISETTQIQLNSQLRVSFLDESRNYVTVTSYDNCTSQGTYSIKTVKEDGKVVGVKTVYDFKDATQSFKIPVSVTLEEYGIKAQIHFDEIEEYGISKLCQIELFPFFSAATGDDKGYLFVPDGSGAIIDFQDRYRNASDYEQPVYGSDAAVNINLKAVDASKGIKMPVYGMKKGDNAFFAVIEKGDALARIAASSAEDRFSASSVWSSFSFRECDETGIVDGDNLIRTVRIADEKPASVNPVVGFRFLSGQEANYSGMAQLYREILVKKYKLEPLKEDALAVSPFLQIFGKTYKKSSFLGIPYNKAVKATTLTDVENMYSKLSKSGVKDFSLALYGFSKGGFNNKYITKQAFDSSLGGNKGFNSLLKMAENATVYAVFNLNRDYSAANKFFKGKKYIQSLNRLTVARETGALSTAAAAGLDKWLLLSGEQMLKNSKKLLKSLKNPENYGVLYQSMGSEVYNNFSEAKSLDRQQLLKIYSEILKNTANTTKSVASDGANVYMLEGADLLTEVPLSSSDFEIFSYSIPFYFMVLQGYVKMASEPINNIADAELAISKCAQYGVMPTYRVTECKADKLKDTNLRFLYNTDFDSNKEKIAKHNEIISDLRKNIGEAKLVSYERLRNISVVTYDNGIRIAVNEDSKEAEFSGNKIPASSACVLN
ncbi:MAG: hypothetical protein IKD04_01050 [Clostridia bacterium]|nr:hypothetical protein [Clostridia bacterium]